MPTKIEWAEESWNPVTGCTKVSAGCANCYAKRMAKRFWKGQKAECDVLESRALLSATRPRRFSDVQCHPDQLDQPLHWRKPRRVIVCSMGDLFHENVPTSFIIKVFDAMWPPKQIAKHIFMVLTKRPERMLDFLSKHGYLAWRGSPWKNVWLGVSVENQATADERIPLLLQTPAAVRFVSVEPMLGLVDLVRFTINRPWAGGEARGGRDYSLALGNDIHWIICGGESGPGARPMHPDWPRSLRDQCESAGVPFFLKQMKVNGKMVKMPMLDGKRWDLTEAKPESVQGRYDVIVRKHLEDNGFLKKKDSDE